MRIKKIKLNNFRCFGPNEVEISLTDLSALIGRNSTGKTAVLQAILKLFGIRNRDRIITRSDFHVPRDIKPEEIEKNYFYIEAVIDFPEIESGESNINNTIPTFFQRMVVDGQGMFPYARIRLEATWEKSNTPDGNIESQVNFITVPEGKESQDESKKIPVYLSDIRSSIHMIYVPAIREPTPQLKNTSGTILFRILESIKWPEDFDKQIKEKIAQVDSLFDNQEGVKKIQKIISNQWKSLHSDSRYSKAKVKFNNGDLATILKKIDVEFSPTELPQSYDIDSLGEGLRSLFYLSLVNSLLDFESIASKERDLFSTLPPSLTILAVEEPENHISPHILGKVIKNLIEISKRDNAQVLLTSHTPSIIKRIDPESISHLRICNETLCTIHNKILLPEETEDSYKYVKEAVRAYPELYFARLVILGEGDTEELIISKAIETSGTSLDPCGISVVPLGGRFVNHFWTLLNQLEIPHITLLDLDSERKGGGWGRIKYAFEQLVKFGINKQELLKLHDEEILSEEQFNNIQNWDLNNLEDRKKLESYVNHLAKWNVFFSNPLDLDFSMLKNFTENYKNIVPEGHGPIIPSKTDEGERFIKRINNAMLSSLKTEGSNGGSYSENEKELMIWYNYLFLNRSKPGTHILVLSKIDDSTFRDNLPNSLKEIIKKVNEILSNDSLSILSEV